MAISNLTYYQTIDAEKYMSEIEKRRTWTMVDLEGLYHLIDDSSYSDGLNTVIEALEALEAIIDGVWGEITARQEELERLDSSSQEELETEARELELAPVR